MHSLLAALNRGEGFKPNSTHKFIDFNVSGEFAAIFNRSLAGGGSSAQSLLSRLRERFPEAKIAEQDVPPGLEESKRAAEADGDKQSAKVNLSSPLLEEMGLDANLAGKIEDIIAGLFSGDTASPPGSYVQRSVSLTVTTVRYTEMLRTDAEGSVLAAAELQTALREKIDEMLADLSSALNAAFGRQGKEGGQVDAAESTEAAESGKSSGASSQNPFGGTAASLWSVELFYSTTMIESSIRHDGTATESAWGGAAVESAWGGVSFAGYSSFSDYASFGGLTGGGLPSFLQQMLDGSGSGGGGAGMTGFFDNALAGTGVSLSGYRQVETGFSFKFTQSRNLIEELMELYGERLGGGRERVATDSDKSAAVDEGAGTKNEAAEEVEEAALAV